MANNIHPTAIVDPAARIGADVTVGPFTVIESDTVIGDGADIGSHILIASGARLGNDVRIHKGAVVATFPQDLKFAGEKTELIIGEGTVIREFVTLNRGTIQGEAVTRIGSNCLIMAYAHVAHDCHVGDRVILANGVTMAGHVTIEDFVGISGMVLIHQFTRIGRHSYIGGGSRVSQDVPPYILGNGEPLKYYGLNAVGLKRCGFTAEQLATIKKAYTYIYRSKLNLQQAVEAIKSELEQTAEIKIILDFIEQSERGIAGK